MQLKETKEALNKFGKYVVQQARSNLTKRKMNVSKDLYDSLKYRVKKSWKQFNINYFYGRIR